MLRVSLLGERTIRDDTTGAVRQCSSRGLALIAYLAVHAGSSRARQEIAGVFWPESPEGQALTNLRRELHHLRRALGDEPALLVTSSALCWRDTGTCRVDVRELDRERRAALDAAGEDHDAILEHGKAALAEYRGELLPGVYDDWLLECRDDLRRQLLELCVAICAAASASGRPAAAVDAARRRIRLAPLDEAGYRTLMELQAALGDRAGAVTTYHHCASTLERELGIEPDRATQATLERLMSDDPALGVGWVSPRAASRPGSANVEFVGRDGELARLGGLWIEAARGSPRIVLVRGDAGVGKSRLVAEVADRVRRGGAIVASARCFGISGRLALAPVADWLRNPAVRAAAAGLEPVWRAEVERLVPAEEGHVESAARGRAMVDAWQRHRFFEGLARAFTGVLRPMLLVLDNAHWCDQETLAFLAYCLTKAAPESPLMLAATMRDDDVEPEFGEWIAQLRTAGLLTDLRLGPLDRDGTARLARVVSGRRLHRDAAALMHGTTGGFPLYVVEAARATGDAGGAAPSPGDLVGVLRHRLDQSGDAARDVAGLAAAVGRDFSLDLLAEASDLDPVAVVRAVDELWRRRIVHELPDGYDFSHDLLREVAYEQVSPPGRWLLHRRIALALERLHRGRIDDVAALLAEQYRLAGQTERALDYYQQAGEAAAGVFAYTEAIRLNREALSLVRAQRDGERRHVRELAVLEASIAPINAQHGYSSPLLREAVEQTVALADRLGRHESLLANLTGLWASQFVQGRLREADATATRVLAMAGDGELSGPPHFAFAGSSLSLGRPVQALRHFDLACERSKGAPSLTIGTRPEIHARAWSAHALWILGRSTDAGRACREAVELGRRSGHPYNLAVALAYGAVTRQLLDDRGAVTELTRELGELCDRYGFAYYREWDLVLDGWARMDEAGFESARRGIDNLKHSGAFTRMPYWLWLLADVAAGIGRAGTARSLLDAALATGHSRNDLWWLPEVMRARAGLDQDSAVGLARLEGAAAIAREQGSTTLLDRCERDLGSYRS